MKYLLEHDVQTVLGRGWASIKNGTLLKLMEENGFQVFVTGDKNIPTQQTLLNRPFAVLVLSTINWPILRRHAHVIAHAIGQAVPGTVMQVDCGQFRPHPR